MGDKCVGAEGNGSEGEQTLLATFLDGGGGRGFGLHLPHLSSGCTCIGFSDRSLSITMFHMMLNFQHICFWLP